MKRYLFLLLTGLFFIQCEKEIPTPVIKPPTGDTTKLKPTGSIDINLNDKKQVIDLIGAGTYFYSGHVMALANVNDAFNWLYKDLDVNAFKIVLRSDKIEDVNDNANPDSTDFSKFNFEASGNTVTQLAMVKKALSINPNLKIWAIVLSPPKYLKTNRNTNNGGTLDANVPNAYEEFGEIVYAQLKYLKNNGVDVSILSLMNEPDFGSTTIGYESAEFTPAQTVAVYTKTTKWLKDKLPGYGLKVPKFAGPELIGVTSTAKYHSALEAAGANIDMYTAHHYSQSSIANFSSASSLVGNKGLYMSEWHTGHGMGSSPSEMPAAFDLVNKFHHAFKGGSKGWLYFEWGNPIMNFGGILFTPFNGTAERRKNYYVFKQFCSGILNSSYVPTTLSTGMVISNDNVSAFVGNTFANVHVVNTTDTEQKNVAINVGKTIKSVNIYVTDFANDNVLIKTISNVNANSVNIDIKAATYTTVQIIF
jgi:O-glycosyl hydrolase